jgi:hypothetical protein
VTAADDGPHWDAFETGSILRRRSRLAARRLAAAQLGARQQARLMLASMRSNPEEFGPDDLMQGVALVAEFDAIIREQEALELEKLGLQAQYASRAAETASVSCAICNAMRKLLATTEAAAEAEAEKLGWGTDGKTWRCPPCVAKTMEAEG